MTENSKNKVFYKNTFMLYIMTATKFVLPVIITACLTRRLGEDGYGIITYMTATMNYFLLFLDFGFNYSSTKKISQNRENTNAVQTEINNVITAKIWLSVSGFIMLLAIIPFINILKTNITLALLYYVSTVANIFIPDFLYRGLEKMEYVTLRYVITKLVATVLIFLCVHGTNEILLIPLFYTVGTLIAAAFTIRHMRKSLGFSVRLGRVKETWYVIKESVVYFASTFATTALSAFNTLIMGIVNFSTAEIAYWGVAFQIVQAIQSLYEPITSSIYPRVSANKNYKFVLKVTKYLSFVVAIGCVAAYFLADIAVKIIAGAGYEPATTVFRLLIPMLLFSFWAQMLGFPFLGAMDQQKKVTISTVAAGGFHIVLSFFFIIIGKFNLVNLSIIRGISEFVLFAIRLAFVAVLLKKLNKQKCEWRTEI